MDCPPKLAYEKWRVQGTDHEPSLNSELGSPLTGIDEVVGRGRSVWHFPDDSGYRALFAGHDVQPVGPLDSLSVRDSGKPLQ